MMDFEFQPIHIQNKIVRLVPLSQGDFEPLYSVASDQGIWEQHPNPDRYRREVFKVFFDGAMSSGGAFLVFDSPSGRLIGSSRYYDHEPENSAIKIGYTFLAREFWGHVHNRALKTVMLDHAFRFVSTVLFHVGAVNKRSQLAMGKLGAEKIGEEPVAYHGEKESLNFVYCIKKADWASRENDWPV